MELLNQFINWSHSQQFRDVIDPLLISSLKDQQTVITPLGKIIAVSLKDTQVTNYL